MAGTLPWSNSPPAGPTVDLNEVLRRIEQKTTEIHNWVRYGMVAIIVLLVLVFVAGL